MRDWRNQLVDDVRALTDAAGANEVTITISGLAAIRDFTRTVGFSAAMTDASDVRQSDFKVQGRQV